MQTKCLKTEGAGSINEGDDSSIDWKQFKEWDLAVEEFVVISGLGGTLMVCFCLKSRVQAHIENHGSSCSRKLFGLHQ